MYRVRLVRAVLSALVGHECRLSVRHGGDHAEFAGRGQHPAGEELSDRRTSAQPLRLRWHLHGDVGAEQPDERGDVGVGEGGDVAVEERAPVGLSRLDDVLDNRCDPGDLRPCAQQGAVHGRWCGVQGVCHLRRGPGQYVAQDQRGAPDRWQVLQCGDEREPDAGMCLDEVGRKNAQARVGLQAIHHTSLKYTWKDYTFLVGIQNVFDKSPPNVSTINSGLGLYNYVGTSLENSQYNEGFLGRRGFVRVSKRF